MILFLVACRPTPPEAPVGIWLAGDLHVHSSVGSNDTDGLGTPAALGPAMAAAGLDFVFLTDHSNSTGSMDCETGDVEDCPNQGPEVAIADWPDGVYLANEISPIDALPQANVPTGHVNCLPVDGVGFVDLDHFVDRPPGTVTGGDAVAQCQDHGGFAVINHPFALVPWIEYDWTSEAFDAIEVYNGGTRFDPFDAEGVAAWETRVAEGRDVVPIGGSDCHRWGTEAPGGLLDPALGWPATHAHVRDGEAPIDAIRGGRVILAEPGTTLSVEARTDIAVGLPGDRVTGPATVTATATAEVPGRMLQIKIADGDVLAEVTVAGNTEISAEVPAGTAVYARVWPADPNFVAGAGGVALTNVIRVE